MAIQHRRGNFADFDPYKMRPGEWAFPLDRGEGYYCISPGDVRRVATKEEIIEILETNQQAYDGLHQLLTELEDETVATGILNDIADLILKSEKNENYIAKINDRHIGTNLISPSSDTYKNLNFSLGESYLGRIDSGLVGGKPITISTILKDTDFFYDGVALRIYFYDESDAQLDFKTGTYATEDGLYSFTTMIPTGTVYAEIYASLPMSYTVDSNTKYKCLKAELGSLATPWKPSIYDLYNEVNTHLADIVQTAEVNSSTKYPSAAVTYNLQQQLNNYSIQNISSAVTTIGITSPIVAAFKFGKLAIVTVRGTATNNISAYAAIAKLNGYTANSTQFFLNTNNKSCVVYSNSSNISCREALSAQEDISFTAIILLN